MIYINNVEFMKSSFSHEKYACVGVAKNRGKILVTNTKKLKGVVEFTAVEWDAFIKGVKNGEFDHFAKS